MKGQVSEQYLEFIQNIITRMNSNSFLIKGWAITIVSALFALAANDSNKNYVLVTYLAIPIFWILDSYYLSLEKAFRDLYKDAVDGKVENYDLNSKPYQKGKFFESVISLSIALLYLSLVIIPLMIMFCRGF